MTKVTIPIRDIREGMQTASNIYNGEDNKILDVGTIITKDIIELLKKNSITTITVTEHLVKNLESVDKKSENKSEENKNTMEENGAKILKIDSSKAKDNMDRSIERTKTIYESVKNGGSMDINSIKHDINKMLSSILENKEAYSHLSMLKRKDESMYKHAVDVATLSAITAKEMTMPNVDIANIMLGALLHDIGKVLIQDSILQKKNLTKEEEVIMRKHPTQGYKLVKRDNLEDIIADIVLEHHERYDGTGYPFQKNNKDISLYAKIVSVCNVFNNLITKGEYGVGLPPDKAVKIIISEVRREFDSDVVKAFQKAIGFYPNNTRVKLSDGSIARVIEQNPALPLRPVLSIAKDHEGKIPDGIAVVDLSQTANLFIKEIM